ncbi:unnamed protein product [Lactuca saligna]|uniref:Uncharacterized protein n=1 Tax=Lactuca saligna TaxID=75948 RepID=A0AA35Z9Y4_LACSI|nr:unnamed protein product [Lactuca saligna]
MIDGRMKLVLSKLNEVLDDTRSLDTAQQGGDKEKEGEANENDVLVDDQILEVNLRNPYETNKMAKTKVAKVFLQKQTLKHKLKNLNEEKIGQKGNVSSRLGKGKEKIEAEEGVEKDFKEALDAKKDMFSKRTIYQIKKAIDNVNLYWLEPHTSFKVKKEKEMDIKIENVLSRMPILKPFLVLDEDDQFQFGFTENEQWGIAYKMKEKEEVKHCMLFLRDKQLVFYFYSESNRSKG